MTNPGTIIYKYPLDDFPGQPQTLQLPLGAHLLTVGLQENQSDMVQLKAVMPQPVTSLHVLWAKVEKDAPQVPYQVICYFTGQELHTNIRHERYLGTTTDKLGLVRHWFECLTR